MRGGTPAEAIAVAEPNAELRALLARDFGVAVHDNALAATARAEVIVLAVKPGRKAKVWLDFDTLLDLEMRKQITHSVKAIAPFAVTEGPVVFALKVATWDAKESKRVAPSPIEWKKATPKGKPLEIGKLVEKVWND